MKMSARALLVLALAFSVMSCADLIDGPFHRRDDDDDHDTIITDTTGNGSNDTTVCFSRDILPILITNCAMAECHDEASHKDGVVLTSYESAMHLVTPGSINKSELYEVITETDPEDIMPPLPRTLSKAQINLIAQWIREGAHNGTCTEDSLCDTTNVTLDADVGPILAKWCICCHGPVDPGAGINLTIRSVVEAESRSGRLMRSITHDPSVARMPPSGPKLDDCSIKKIQVWIQQGFR
jgi:mono/diheme cytochrome c family protein